MHAYYIYTDMISKKSREKLSRIRQQIYRLSRLRETQLKRLLHPKPMIIGSLYEVYKTCSKPNCCCKKGQKHGPFFALSISIDAKRTVKMVKKKDLTVVKKKALSYQAFQQGLARIRKTNKEVDTLLEQIKQEFMEEYH
jgi:hypothetical protein